MNCSHSIIKSHTGSDPIFAERLLIIYYFNPHSHTGSDRIDIGYADTEMISGVWIEIESARSYASIASVTPCMGVWIEIFWWGRNPRRNRVTPCMGVWIAPIQGVTI